MIHVRQCHDEGARLVAEGWTFAEAAREVGMKPGSLKRALERRRQRDRNGGEQVAS